MAAFGLVGGASILVLHLNYQRVIATLDGTVAAVDNLAHARLTTMQAFVSSEQIEAGDPTFGPSRGVADLTRAVDLVDDLREGRTSLLLVRRGVPLRNDTLLAASQGYSEAIAQLQTRLAAGMLSDPAERRIAFSAVENAATRLEYGMYEALRGHLASLERRHRSWMAGWSGFLFLTALGLLTLHRGQRRSDEAKARAERDRARSEARFRSLIEHAPDLIFLLNAEGGLEYESPSAKRALGYSQGELARGNYFDRLHPEDRADAWRAFEDLVRAPGRSLAGRSRYRRHEGEWNLLEFTATNLLHDPAVEAVVINAHDVTDRARALEDLRDSEESYRTLFDSLAELVYIQNLQGRFLNVNEAMLRRYGYDREEVLGRTPDLLADPARTDLAWVQALFRRACEGEAQRFEFWARTREGESFPKEVTLTHGRYFGEDVVIAVARDITERKEAEEQLRERERRELLIRTMELERSRLSALFEQAPAFIALLQGPEHVVELSNPRHDRLIGQRDILGRPVREALPELGGQGLFDVLDRVYRTGEAYIANGHRIYLQREQGREPEEGYFNLALQPFVGPEGSVSGIFVHGVEVTELIRARQEAEAANRAKSEFLSRMSHELRTPLNAILGFGQLLEMEVDTEENQESVEQILKGGQHLLALIDEVLDIARIEAGQMSLSVEPVSVRRVVQESVTLVSLTAAKQGIGLRAQDALATERFVQADQQRLKQVLLNLLSNAIKYNRRAGTVTLSCAERGEDRLRLVVHDTGYGIPAEKMGGLFTPFDRLGADQTGIEGTGLGLAISKGLVEAMGGRLGVESVEGEGTCFWIELPLAPRHAVAEPASEASAPESTSKGAEPSHTVLIIEDNLNNVRLLERVFQRRPQVRLLTAMQGRLGLELAREHRSDLILLDLNLPDLSGDGVLLQLRQDPELRDIPVVMISGDAIPSQIQRLLAMGARDYITKPFDVRELLRVVDEIIPQAGV